MTDFDGRSAAAGGESLRLLINSITRKYGGQDDVLEYFAQISKNTAFIEVTCLQRIWTESWRLRESWQSWPRSWVRLCHGLCCPAGKRKRRAAVIHMEKARFKVQFSKGKFNREGNEQAEFMISQNPSEDLNLWWRLRLVGSFLSHVIIKSAFFS